MTAALGQDGGLSVLGGAGVMRDVESARRKGGVI